VPEVRLWLHRQESDAAALGARAGPETRALADEKAKAVTLAYAWVRKVCGWVDGRFKWAIESDIEVRQRSK